MYLLKNRIVISILVIIALANLWEFRVTTVSGLLYTMAVKAYRRRNYRLSFQLLEHAHRLAPQNSAISTLMGWDRLKVGDPQAAESYFRQAQAAHSGDAEATLGYAYAEIAQGKYELAARALETLRSWGDDAAGTHMAWGILYRQTGQSDKAATEFYRVLSVDKNNAEAMQNLREIRRAEGR